MKKILIFFLVISSSALAGSMLGLDALGKEDVAGATAAIAGRGFAGGAKTGDGLSLMNPSALAFEDNVSFSATMDYEMTSAESGEDSYVSNTMTLPSLYLSFPMGSFGAFALGISQRYASTLEMESEDSLKNQDVKLDYSGSVFEFVPTYSIRLPFYRRVSLGASMHIVSGSIERSLRLGPDNSGISKKDFWATNSSKVTELVEGDFETEKAGYYTLSAMYRGPHSSYYFSATTPYTLVNSLSYDFRFSQRDTLSPYKNERQIEVPLTLSTGVDYRLFANHHVMFDFMMRSWDEDIQNMAGSWDIPITTETQTEFLVALGYQKDGSKELYEKYWKRMQFRLGAWYRDWYIKDVSEYGGALGVGLPLGTRGTIVDVSLQGGLRDAGSFGWDETFFGIRVTLTGVGSWGKTHNSR